ncbi:hypothetical protein Tco_0311302 [Tanacetum coccineum]
MRQRQRQKVKSEGKKDEIINFIKLPRVFDHTTLAIGADNIGSLGTALICYVIAKEDCHPEAAVKLILFLTDS